MEKNMYKLPADLAQDIENHAVDVRRFLAGELSPSIFKARRVPRGMYEQRQNGAYMVRVRIAGGRFYAEQALVLAELSQTYGNGMLHVTDRQDVQLHDIDIKDTPEILRRLAAAGLAAKGGGGNTVRNVTACPYAGICPGELFDVAPLAFAVTEYLIAQPGSYNLPRKFKIAFSGCNADCALAEVNDVGFIAEISEGRLGFRAYAGGGMGASPRIADLMLDWIPATEVIRFSEAVRRLFDRLGDRHNKHRARLRFVFEKMGAETFRGALRAEMEQVIADGVPACGAGVEASLNAESGKTAGKGIEFTKRNGTRVFEQRQSGYVAVPMHIPLGFVSCRDLSLMADISERFSAEKGLRTTQSQDLLLGFVRSEQLADAFAALGGLSVNVLAMPPLASFVSCAGASTCRLGLCLSRGAATACAEALQKDGIREDTLDKLDIRISGCQNCCGQHPIGAIGLFGAAQRHDGRLVPSYGVLLGGRCGNGKTMLGRQIGMLPARALPAFILDLLREFQTNRAGRESFPDYCERIGADRLIPRIERHSHIPDYSENPEYFKDWGQTEDFSLAGRGPGECGAGVFEVVGEDITAAKRALSAATAPENRQESLFKALLATVRALLIVRGIDTLDANEIFRAFETHFVDTRLVNEEFRGLLSRGRGYLQGWNDALADRKEEIGGLLERVELLFSTLDANLAFHPPESRQEIAVPSVPSIAPPPKPANEATAKLDLHGVACPMNFVKAKLRLETMEVGETLSIVLDDGEPIQNVPASFRNEGQEVVKTARLESGRWEAIIKKTR